MTSLASSSTERRQTLHAARPRAAWTLPRQAAGVGFKPVHTADIIGEPRQVDFFEVHAENYMGAGGPSHHLLEGLRRDYPLSIHGVGLSIGGADPLDRDHLGRLKTLLARYQPALFSEHLAWSSHGGQFMNDLLPLPYTAETLAGVVDHIHQAQDALQTRLLLENPSTYLRFAVDAMSEADFLRAVAIRTGCGLLLDVNNLFVTAVNLGLSPEACLDAFPLEHVGQIHLAGFDEDRDEDGARLLVDTHGCAPAAEVWALYRRALRGTGAVPTLVEWDNQVPSFDVLATQAGLARTALAATLPPRARATARRRDLIAA